MVYRIRLKGHLDARWLDWFDGVTITPEAGGDTVLTCVVADQSALFGVLRKVRNLGIPLIAVNRISPGPDASS